MSNFINDRLCCKYWSITDRPYEIYQRYKSISDSFAIFAIFKNVVISLIIILKIVINYNFSNMK